MSTPHPVAEVFGVFLKLGLTSFGGPVAHLGYHRDECVTRRRWLDESAYADLVGLCQFLPGPTSSQVVFALGLRRAGPLGALAASLAFTLPSALLMIAFARGVVALDPSVHANAFHGLRLAAAAVVAQAVLSMGLALCPDRPRKLVALAAAAVCLALPGSVSQLVALALGALWGSRAPTADAPAPPAPAAPSRASLALVALFALSWALPAALARLTHARAPAVFEAFYRVGALVFGGGHVALPLLRETVVARGWVPDDVFLAGYGAAQCLPGPLFTFAGFLGASMPTTHPWLWGFGCLFAMFLPGWLLVAAALPVWERLRENPRAQGVLRGANASVVGVLLAALCTPVLSESVRSPWDASIALAAFGLLVRAKAPPWSVVLACAAAGALR